METDQEKTLPIESNLPLSLPNFTENGIANPKNSYSYPTPDFGLSNFMENQNSIPHETQEMTQNYIGHEISQVTQETPLKDNEQNYIGHKDPEETPEQPKSFICDTCDFSTSIRYISYDMTLFKKRLSNFPRFIWYTEGA